jgi:hypothetical protein
MINLSGFQPSTPIQIRQSLMPETVPPPGPPLTPCSSLATRRRIACALAARRGDRLQRRLEGCHIAIEIASGLTIALAHSPAVRTACSRKSRRIPHGHIFLT